MSMNQGNIGSGYLRHMTEDDLFFSSITKINGEKVIFVDNLKGKIIGVGNMDVSPLP